MLQAPLVNARNVVIKHSITDRFVQAFISAVDNNPPYLFDPQQAGHVSFVVI